MPLNVYTSRRDGRKLIRVRIEFFADLNLIALAWIDKTAVEEAHGKTWRAALSPPSGPKELADVLREFLADRGWRGSEKVHENLGDDYGSDMRYEKRNMPFETWGQYLCAVVETIVLAFPELKRRRQ